MDNNKKTVIAICTLSLVEYDDGSIVAMYDTEGSVLKKLEDGLLEIAKGPIKDLMSDISGGDRVAVEFAVDFDLNKTELN